MPAMRKDESIKGRIGALNSATQIVPYGRDADAKLLAVELAFREGFMSLAMGTIAKNERQSMPEGVSSLKAKIVEKQGEQPLLDRRALFNEQEKILARRYAEHPWTDVDVVAEEIALRQWFFKTYGTNSCFKGSERGVDYLEIKTPAYCSPRLEKYLDEEPLNDGEIDLLNKKAEGNQWVFLRIGWWQHPFYEDAMIYTDSGYYKYISLFSDQHVAVQSLIQQNIVTSSNNIQYVDAAFNAEYLAIPIHQISEFALRRSPNLGSEVSYQTRHEPEPLL